MIFTVKSKVTAVLYVENPSRRKPRSHHTSNKFICTSNRTHAKYAQSRSAKGQPWRLIWQHIQSEWDQAAGLAYLSPLKLQYIVNFHTYACLKVVVPPYLNFLPKFNFLHIHNIDWQWGNTCYVKISKKFNLAFFVCSYSKSSIFMIFGMQKNKPLSMA